MERTIWVGVWDLHFPLVHKPTWNAITDFIKRNHAKIAGFYFGGDQFNNDEISHHTQGKPLLRPPGSYKANTEKFDKQILQPIEALLPKDCLRIWQIGNHDDWENQLVEHMPELQGTVERPIMLNLEARGWDVLKVGEHLRLGKLTLLHGEVLSGIGNQASVYHAKRAVETYCSSVVYGHMHSPQSYTKVLPHNQRDKWQAYCAPTAGSVNPLYLRNRPTAWLNGFVIIEVHKGGNFNVYPVIVSDGCFAFGGEIYGAKA